MHSLLYLEKLRGPFEKGVLALQMRISDGIGRKNLSLLLGTLPS